MNTSYLKYKLKIDYRRLGIILGMVTLMYGFILLVSNPQTVFRISDFLLIIYMTLNVWALVYVIKIYAHFLDRDVRDVYGSIPIKKSTYFNTLLIRTFCTVVIPNAIALILLYILGNDNFSSYALENVTLINMAANLFIFSVFLFFVTVCGTTWSLIVNGLITIVFIGTSFDILETLGNEAILTIIGFIISIVLIMLTKEFFNKREVDRLGNTFLFDKFEIIFSVIYTTLVGASAAISDFSVMSNTTVAIFNMTWSLSIFYFICLLVLNQGIKGYFKKAIYVLIPLGISYLTLLISMLMF